MGIQSELRRQRRKIDEFGILYVFDICVFNIVKIDNKRSSSEILTPVP